MWGRGSRSDRVGSSAVAGRSRGVVLSFPYWSFRRLLERLRRPRGVRGWRDTNGDGPSQGARRSSRSGRRLEQFIGERLPPIADVARAASALADAGNQTPRCVTTAPLFIRFYGLVRPFDRRSARSSVRWYETPATAVFCEIPFTNALARKHISSAQTGRVQGFLRAERRRSRTYLAWGCQTSPVLKTQRAGHAYQRGDALA